MQTTRTAVATTTGREPKSVLIVEDDEDARFIYEATLTHAGFRVTSAKSIREATEAVRTGHARPNLVVLDCWLPDGNGLDLLARWRRSPWMARVPIIVLTAFSEDQHVAAAEKGGARAFVVKPCPGDVLATYVERALTHHQQPQSQRQPANANARSAHHTELSPRLEVVHACDDVHQMHTRTALRRLRDGEYQAQCEACYRSSPIIRGSMRQGEEQIADLGWRLQTRTLLCPICLVRKKERLTQQCSNAVENIIRQHHDDEWAALSSIGRVGVGRGKRSPSGAGR